VEKAIWGDRERVWNGSKSRRQDVILKDSNAMDDPRKQIHEEGCVRPKVYYEILFNFSVLVLLG
jgi:hypothetical protein